MLTKFYQFVKDITIDSSRKHKMEILKQYKEDEDILYLLNFLYNPYITTGISEKKLNKSFDKFDEEVVGKVFLPESNQVAQKPVLKMLLDYLQQNNTGTDTDIKLVQMFRFLYFQDNATLFDKIITKNLPLGIDAKTINKVIPNLIPEFNVMLANKYFDNPSVVEGRWFALTTKIDGSRIIAMKNNGEVSFWTRQGQKYIGLVDLENELKYIEDDNFVLDGELVAIDTDKEDTYKNTMKLSRTKDEEKHGLKMLVFDYMPVANWLIQNCPLDYITRRRYLDVMFDLNYFEYFEKLPVLYCGRDTSRILDELDEQVNNGEEGIMINICAAPYEFKRTNNLLKVKKFQDTELEVIGFEEGTNKLSGTLGAFICKYKDNTVKVGSGLSDEDRQYFWNNQDKIIGKYITVKYFEESTDSKTGLKSLRFPTYMRVRED